MQETTRIQFLIDHQLISVSETPDIDVPVSTAVSSALIHLEHAIDGMHSASPTHPSFDLFFNPVVHTILAPLNSQFMRPNLPPRVFTAEFWHAHFNYAALRTDSALAAIGSMDGLVGDQICQWNSVAPDSILPATHLSVFVPPPLGAFVLANHQNYEDFKSTPASAAQSSWYNKTFSFLCHRFLVTKTNFSLSLDCQHPRVT